MSQEFYFSPVRIPTSEIKNKTRVLNKILDVFCFLIKIPGSFNLWSQEFYF
jgi:hypothetical protein